MNFEHSVIDPETPGTENDVCLIADVNGNGYNDIVIGGKKGEGNIVWYEHPSWKRHTIGTAALEAGGDMVDITRNGRLDLLVGNPEELNDGKDLYWFENPGTDQPWTKRIICSDYKKYHNQIAADIDNDNEQEIIFLSQVPGIVGYYDIPPDPTVSPWPEKYRHIIAEGMNIEGLAVADLDNDGKNELVAGPYWFKKTADGWQKHPIEESFQLTCVAVGDLNNDGKMEVVIAEGESNPARLAWFSGAPDFKEMHLLADDLFHPHSLELADFTGNGLLDIFIAEMGLGKNPAPKVLIYENKGNGVFERFVVDDNCATHMATVGDIGKSGRMSIVGKPYDPGRQVDLWLNKG